MTKAEQFDGNEFADWDSFTQATKKAIRQGAETMTLPTAFLIREIDRLQPLDFIHLREVYNRLCDKHGLPGEKKPVPPQEDRKETF